MPRPVGRVLSAVGRGGGGKPPNQALCLAPWGLPPPTRVPGPHMQGLAASAAAGETDAWDVRLHGTQLFSRCPWALANQDQNKTAHALSSSDGPPSSVTPQLDVHGRNPCPEAMWAPPAHVATALSTPSGPG